MKFPFALLFVAAFAAQSGANAQNTPQTPSTTSAAPAAAGSETKRDLAAKLVLLQRGPEMDRMTFQLTSGAVQPLINKWAPKLEALPKASMEKARDQLNAELKSLGDSTRELIETQMGKSASTTLLPAYMERFSEDEMKQLLALFESPAFKKYQGMAPELGNVWLKDVVEKTRDAVIERGKAFDATAEKILGEKPGASSKAPAPAKAASAAKK